MAKKAKTVPLDVKEDDPISFLTGDGYSIEHILPHEYLWQAEKNGPYEFKRSGAAWSLSSGVGGIYISGGYSSVPISHVFVDKLQCMNRVVAMREEWVKEAREELKKYQDELKIH